MPCRAALFSDEQEAAQVLWELMEHEQELADALTEVRVARMQLATLLKNIRRRPRADEPQTRGVN
jgi:hypothetical protein